MVSLRDFITAQRECKSCYELARYLGQKSGQVRQRIRQLRRKGYGNKLRPYPDFDLQRGRRSIHDEMAYIDDYSEPVIADESMNEELIEIKTHSPQTV